MPFGSLIFTWQTEPQFNVISKEQHIWQSGTIALMRHLRLSSKSHHGAWTHNLWTQRWECNQWSKVDILRFSVIVRLSLLSHSVLSYEPQLRTHPLSHNDKKFNCFAFKWFFLNKNFKLLIFSIGYSKYSWCQYKIQGNFLKNTSEMYSTNTSRNDILTSTVSVLEYLFRVGCEGLMTLICTKAFGFRSRAAATSSLHADEKAKKEIVNWTSKGTRKKNLF